MTATDLVTKKCVPCEGGVQPLSGEQIAELAQKVPQWRLSADMKSLRREWRVKDIPTALDFFNRIGEIAEAESQRRARC